MLGGFWLVITALLLIASLAFHQAVLFLMALIFFLVGGAARLWDKYSLRRVEYNRRLSADHVFFGEQIEVEIEVANRKILPLPWLEVDDEIPEEITLLKGSTSPSTNSGTVKLNNVLSLNSYHKIKRRFLFECLHRGYFTFGPASISSGDVFGFFNRNQSAEVFNHLTVYPKIVPLEKLIVPSNEPLGNIRTKNYLFEDPILTMGVREYHYGDRLKQINWKNTARTGKLQTRVLEPTTTMDIAVFLDVRTVPRPYWGNRPDLLELAIITATSLANYGLSHDYRVGLYVNQYKWATHRLIRIPPSQATGQFKQLLETLAPIPPLEAAPIDEVVSNESKNLPWGSSLVVITASPGEDLLSALMQIKRVGRKTSLIVIGGEELPKGVSGITTYHVSESVDWQNLETVTIGVK
jgi:uncharacterized protein (DUF58 family)